MYVLYDETAGKESEFSIDVVSLRNIKVLYAQERTGALLLYVSLVVGASLLVWSLSLSLSLSLYPLTTTEHSPDTAEIL